MRLKHLLFCLLFLLIYCCGYEKQYKDYEIPLSIKELKFVKTLEKKGYRNIVIHKSSLTDGYSIELKSKTEINKFNVDSFINIRKSISLELYSSVLDEDYLFYIKRIGVDFKINPGQDYDPFYNSNWNIDIKIDSLKKWSGIVVVKLGENKFKRVQLVN